MNIKKRNDKNKDKLEMIILKHLREKDTVGKLDESDDEMEVVNEMEEILQKENVGMNEKMQVPNQSQVKQDIKNMEMKEKKNENNEKKNILENEEKVKIHKAKNAIKELEKLMDKRIMLKSKKKNGQNSNRNGNENDTVTTAAVSKCIVVEQDNGNNNNNRNDVKMKKTDEYNFDLGYTVNMEHMYKNGVRLNIPGIMDDDPFANLTRLQRVTDENGQRIKYGSRNYNINELANNEVDSEDDGNGSKQ